MEKEAQYLSKITFERTYFLYGDILPGRIQKRIEDELKKLVHFEKQILSSMKTVQSFKEAGLLMVPRGKITNSFVYYLLGLSNVNPLPRHSYCPKCHCFHWGNDSREICEVCGEKLIHDGYDLPFDLYDVIDERFLKFDYSCAYHLSANNQRVRTYEHSLMKLASLLCVSQEEIDQFDPNTNITDILKCLDYEYYEKHFKKTSICSHLPFIGIADLGNEQFKSLQDEYHVEDFGGLVKLSSILRGTGVYDANEENLININQPDINDTITSREDLYQLLIEQQFSKEDAYLITHQTRLGKLSSLGEEKLKEAKVDKKYINYMKRIKYLFYKGYAVSHLKVVLILAKIYLEDPLRYYRAFYTLNLDLLKKIPANPDYFKLLFETKDYEMEKVYLGIIDLMERGYEPAEAIGYV